MAPSASTPLSFIGFWPAFPKTHRPWQRRNERTRSRTRQRTRCCSLCLFVHKSRSCNTSWKWSVSEAGNCVRKGRLGNAKLNASPSRQHGKRSLSHRNLLDHRRAVGGRGGEAHEQLCALACRYISRSGSRLLHRILWCGSSDHRPAEPNTRRTPTGPATRLTATLSRGSVGSRGSGRGRAEGQHVGQSETVLDPDAAGQNRCV